VRTYLRQRRQLLWWLTALALFFAAYFALRTDRTAMNRLCGSVIFPAMRQVARLCDGFDGSVGEVLILTAIWAGLIWLACTVRRLIAGPRRRAVLADFVLTAACLMLTVYGGFCLLWGTAYSTDSFQDRSGIVAAVASVLSECSANIDDISQTILGDIFSMTMLVTLKPEEHPFNEVQDKLEAVGKQLGVQITLQREDLFQYMYKI